MKKFSILLCALGMWACQKTPAPSSSSAETAISSSQTAQKQSENTSKLVIQVSGMTCTGCEETIKSALSPIPGVDSVSSNHQTGVVVVQSHGDLNPIKAQVMMALAKTDYAVEKFQIEGK